MNATSPYQFIKELKEFLNQQKEKLREQKNVQAKNQNYETATLYRNIEKKLENFLRQLELKTSNNQTMIETFDKTLYAEAKEEVIKKIKETHKWDTTEGFIADGVICPEIYEKQKVRFLVLLAESYGYSGHGLVDIEEQPDEDVLGVGDVKRQTPRKISALLWLVFQSLDSNKKVEWEQFPNLLEGTVDNYNKLQETLARIAYLNVKKASRPIEQFGNGATRLNYSEIYESGCKNQDILRLQIESIKPHFIIVCSDPVFECVYDNSLVGEKIEFKKWSVQTNEFGQKVIYVSHPNYLTDWGYESLYETYGLIYNSLNSSN